MLIKTLIASVVVEGFHVSLMDIIIPTSHWIDLLQS